jgi:D-alanyl-D-alanine carboxypeptidase
MSEAAQPKHKGSGCYPPQRKMRSMKLHIISLDALFSLAAPAMAGESDTALRATLQRELNAHLVARSKIEHISAISVSISLRGGSQNINLSAGVTKSFTAATILQLEAEGKLSIDQTIGHWLPQYPAWNNVTIRRLLNLTSGIPSYDRVPAMLEAYVRDPNRNFTVPELIAYVYPGNPHAPPPTTG